MSVACDRLFFDALPPEAVENVLRFISQKPRHSNWMDYIKPNVLITLLNTAAEFRNCIRQRINAIEVSDRDVEEQRGVLLAGAGSENRKQFPKLASALSGALSEVHISRSTFPWAWQQAIVLHCSQIRKLSLATTSDNVFPMWNILRSCGASLEALDIRFHSLSVSDISAVADNCCNLRCFSLIVNRVHLAVDLSEMWSSIGAHLAQVRLGLTGLMGIAGFQRFALGALAQHCRGLTNISLEKVPELLRNFIVDICTGYGGDLIILCLSNCGFEPQHFARVSQACPSVQYVILEDGGCPAPVLSEIGAKALRVSIGTTTYAPEAGIAIENLDLASEKCENLEAISLSVPNPFAKAPHEFFVHPKMKLREFKAIMSAKNVACSVLEMMSNRINSLEVLTLVCPFLAAPLRNIVNANPKLRKVRVRAIHGLGLCKCRSLTSSELYVLKIDNWGTMVSSFLLNPMLQDIELTCSKDIKSGPIREFVDSCYPAQQRNVSVSICDFQYY